jgi:hypothetical protein
MFLVGRELWIYGGRDGTGKIVGDMFMISLESFAVTQVRYASGPIPRVAFGWAASQHALYIYGGGTKTTQAMGDFWIFDFQSKLWTQLESDEMVPPAMIGCALALLPDCLLLIGMKSEGRKECVIFQFSITNQCWQRIKVPSNIRLPWPVIVPVDDCLLVMSGSTTAELFRIEVVNGECTMGIIETTGIAPLSEEGRRNDEAEVTAGDGISEINLLASSGVLYKEWLIVPGNGERMQGYAICFKESCPKWFAVKSSTTTCFIHSRSCYALCAGAGCLWMHGGVTRAAEVVSDLFKIQVVGPDTKASRQGIAPRRSTHVQDRSLGHP